MKKTLFLVGAMLVVSSNIEAQQEKVSNIEEVNIASKTKQNLYKTGRNVQIITAEDLKKQQGKSLTEVLNQVSGIHITGSFSNTPEPKGLKIRGGKSANILILLDGIPLKDVTGNDYTLSDLRLIALENIESIEILNSAASVLYGSNATVSVINIKTKQNTIKPVEGLISLRGGSFSTFGQNLSIKGNKDHFSYQLSAFNERSKGISSALGENFEEDGFEKQNINANVGYYDEKFHVNLSGGWNHHLFDYDGGAFTDAENRSDDQQTHLSLNAGYHYKNGELTINSRYTDNDRIGKSWINEKYTDQFSYAGQNFFAEIYNTYRFTDYVSITAGIMYEDQRMDAYSLPWGATELLQDLSSEQTNIQSIDAFATLQFHHGLFYMDAGTRMIENSEFGNHFVYSVNPYILKENATFYWKAGYSYSTAFIAPTLYQTFGSLPYVLPNFNLQPETNKTHEIHLSAGKKDRSLNLIASFFQRNEEDAFVYQTVDLTTYAGQFQNIAENTAKGFEIGLDYQPYQFLRLGGNFSFVEKEDAASMLRQPKQRVNSFLDIKPFKGSSVLINHQFVSSRQDSYYDTESFAVAEVLLEPFHVFNLNISQQITPDFSAYLNIGNLLNENYVDVIGYRVKPRNFTFGINYQF